MAEYKYGVYGYLGDSVVSSSASSGTVAVYVGTAPVNLVRGYAEAGVVNRPVKLRHYQDAQTKIGVADDWDAFTLSEAVEAHFNNTLGNIGPIFVINVLDPDIHRGSDAVEVPLAFTNGRAAIASQKIILDTISLDGKTEGVDYKVSYDFAGGKANIISLDTDNPISGTVSASYFEVDPSAVGLGDIIGQKTSDGEYSGLAALELIYQLHNAIPNLLAAPKWSAVPKVYRAMVSAVQKICGHWDAFVFADMPVSETKEIYIRVNPNPGDNPSGEGWYVIVDGNYTVTADTHVQEGATYYRLSYSYAKVTPEAGANPSQEGWYEKDGDSYKASEDGSVQEGKDYYSRSNVYSAVTDADPGDDPSAEGWYELDGSSYEPSTDDVVNPADTYYEAEVVTNIVDTMAKAVEWKATNGFTSERSKVFWPLAVGTDGKVYHISTLAMAETLRIDSSHDGVPYETCGNKVVSIQKQYFGAASKNAGFSQFDSDELTQKGIATVTFWGGSWVLWGDSTAAYEFGNDNIDARAYFDVTMRMLLYITNGFQRRWSPTIDKPMTIALKDTIINREQELLDGLVTRGALIGSPKVSFIEENNPKETLILGQFRWDIQCTPTLPLKSATAYVAYTDEGLSAYF